MAESRRGFLATGGVAMLGAAGIFSAMSQSAMGQQPAPPILPLGDFGWGDGIKRIKAAGKLVVAQSGNQIPPQYFRDPATNQPAGYDAEVARLIAKDLGVEAVFEEAVVAGRISPSFRAMRYVCWIAFVNERNVCELGASPRRERICGVPSLTRTTLSFLLPAALIIAFTKSS